MNTDTTIVAATIEHVPTQDALSSSCVRAMPIDADCAADTSVEPIVSDTHSNSAANSPLGTGTHELADGVAPAFDNAPEQPDDEAPADDGDDMDDASFAPANNDDDDDADDNVGDNQDAAERHMRNEIELVRALAPTASAEVAQLLAVVDDEDSDVVMRRAKRAARKEAEVLDEPSAEFSDSDDNDSDDDDDDDSGDDDDARNANNKRAHSARAADAKRARAESTPVAGDGDAAPVGDGDGDAAPVGDGDAAAAAGDYLLLVKELVDDKDDADANGEDSDDEDNDDCDEDLDEHELICKRIATDLFAALPTLACAQGTLVYAETNRDDCYTLERQPGSGFSATLKRDALLLDLRNEDDVIARLDTFIQNTDPVRVQMRAARMASGASHNNNNNGAKLVTEAFALDDDDDDAAAAAADADADADAAAAVDLEPSNIVEALWLATNALVDEDIADEAQLANWARDMNCACAGWVRRGTDCDLVLLVYSNMRTKWTKLAAQPNPTVADDNKDDVSSSSSSSAASASSSSSSDDNGSDDDDDDDAASSSSSAPASSAASQPSDE